MMRLHRKRIHADHIWFVYSSILVVIVVVAVIIHVSVTVTLTLTVIHWLF